MKVNSQNQQALRGEITRTKILEAAKIVFLNNGFREATVTLIAKKAQIGYGTVYSHFPSGKDEVLLEIMDEVMSHFYNIAEIEYTPNSREEAYKFTTRNTTNFLKLAVEYRDLLAIFYEAIGLSELIRMKWDSIIEKIIERVSQNVQMVKEKGLIQNVNYNPRVVAGSLIYPCEKFLWKIALNTIDEHYEDIARDLAEIYTYGLYK